MIQAGIIAHTREDAANVFKDKLKFAFDHLDPRVRTLFTTTGDSSGELSLSHGSLIRVGTSLRSSTLQYLHISEFGKICAKYPEKAKEVISGALQTVQIGQSVIIESTAEGKTGAFYDLCESAAERKRNATPLSLIDFSFHFFSWHEHSDYTM